jgi:hypothetical protein
MSSPLQLPNASEPQVLEHLVVRPITEDERSLWNTKVADHHYLKNATLVGEQLCYVAEYQGRWLALLGWSAPARHLRPRDAWIGWSKEQRAARRHLLANNARFCILADPHQLPNLASRALALCTARLSADWQERWGHPILAVESFVDGQLFRGTAYKAAGWQRLDESLHEDKSRVRSVSGVAVLGVLSRISLALFQADCQRPQPVRDKTYPVWSGRLQQQPRPMLDRLLKSFLSR